jgi:hypothetical protein
MKHPLIIGNNLFILYYFHLFKPKKSKKQKKHSRNLLYLFHYNAHVYIHHKNREKKTFTEMFKLHVLRAQACKTSHMVFTFL